MQPSDSSPSPAGRISTRRDTRRYESDPKHKGGYGGRLKHELGTNRYVSKVPDPSRPGADISVTLHARNWTEARKLHEDRLVKTRLGEEVVPSKATLADMFAIVRTTFEGKIETGERADTTLERYKLQFAKHIKDDLRGPVQKLTHTRIEAWLTRKRKEGLSASTVTSLYRLLSLLLNQAVREGVIRETPLKRIQDPPRQRPKTAPRRLNDDESSKLIAATADNYRVLMTLLAFCGLRISEALGLWWEDIDLQNGVLHVEKQLARKKRGQPAKRVPLKGARRSGGARREVDLVPELVTLLKKHKRHAFERGYAKPKDFVFTTSIGTPLTYKNILDRVFTPAADAAGLNGDDIADLTPHDLRHTAISRWIALGLDPVEVARQAGDTVEVILSTYAGEFDRARRSKGIRDKLAEGTNITLA
jgi:integrase